MRSTRQIENISIGAEHQTIVHQDTSISNIFKKFGKNFKKIELIIVVISFSTLKRLLIHCHNLEDLFMRTVIISLGNDKPLKQSLKLFSLKTVTMLYCSKEIQEIALGFNPRTIKSFTVCSNEMQFLSTFLAKQNKINRLSLKGSTEMFEMSSLIIKMNLEELSFVVSESSRDFRLMLIILRQSNTLKAIDLSSSRCCSSLFLCLSEKNQLEILKIVINEISVEDFEKISLFTNLKELTLIKNDGMEDTTHLIKLYHHISSNNKIRSLEVLFPAITINGTIFSELAKKMPLLEHLHIDCTMTSSYIVSNVMSSFQYLKSLNLHEAHRLILTETESWALENGSYVNQDMRELTLPHLGDNWRLIEVMIQAFPNLKKLKFETSVTGEDFEVMFIFILSRLNLQELVIFNHELWLIESGCIPECLKNEGPNMRLVSFNAIRKDPNISLEQIFGQSFADISLVSSHLKLTN